MSLAANAPHAFAIRNIETGAIRDERFTRNSAASKASWLLGGDKDGLDHDVVGLDGEGRAWRIEVYPHTDRTNPTGYILTERLPVVKARKAPKAAKPSRPALRLVGASL
jgi:hypothetical protein